MSRLLGAAAAVGLLLGSTGLAFAQTTMQPVYSPGDPGYYGQPQYAPYAPPPYWGSAGPGDGTHSTGTGGRAYPGGQKTN